MRIIASLLLVFAVISAQAQSWPTKPVRVVVAFAPGGSLDFVTRIVSERLSQDLGQQFVVENRAGANGNVGAEYVARQPADGYTVLASADALVSSAHVYKLNYDALKDLVPAVQFTRQPLVLAVHPSLGVNSVAELVAAAKKNPGLGYATSGSGSGQHMVGEWLAKLAGIKLTHVPYKGGGQAITDLVGGQVKIGSLGSTPVMPHYKAGKLKIIAQTTAKRAPSLPEVPTYQEQGLAIELDQWLGFLVPAGTPADVVRRLNAATAKVLAIPAVQERFAPQGLEVASGSPEEFAKLYKSDYDKYGRLVKELGIRAD
ncbi:MAG TPA: tripartite tricarboxylate transporter substrate binding protein [Burkholderiales bacterium]|nr:tripartite tricarboxylate transporter substrate binding protein [Burkholderiales bacterium]